MGPTKDGTNELYAGLSPDVRQELASHEKAATLPRGARLLRGGVPADRLIILHSGSVETSILIAGKIRRVAIDGPGKVFALDSIISGGAVHANVTCLEECCVTLLPKAALLDVLQRNPQMYFAVAKVLSAELAAADRIIRNYARGTSTKSTAKCFRPA